ncbi:MAG: biotin--[acetyl-CoA-carboxylase] ligase [Pseudomonadales bacterium]|nr:biotin--[acetyl-CoA-carboxylase] ligase [Pseudomonadales bacterium]
MGSLSGLKEADQQLIRLLADGQFRSGSELGELLGVSRAAVWKRAQRLADFGLALESVKGKGYRLSSPLQLIDPDHLQALLADRADLHYHWVTESTNSDALALTGPVRRPQVFVAECQLSGRGRRGRHWRSPFAANLYLSIRFPVVGGFSALGGLSLAVGAAVADALRSLDGNLPVTLKWPNDLWINGAKVGGVLIELAGEMDGQVDVVVGVGLNGRMTALQAEGIDQRWTDLASELAVMPHRTELAGAVLSALLDMLPVFSAQGFAAFVADFERYDAVKGKKVKVQSGDQILEGVAAGVSADGALKVETGEGLRELYGGEVSLRVQ